MAEEKENTGALSGLRVIELGQLLAGPFCAQLMADHGAEVIKVEQPGTGDPMRQWGRKIPLWWSVVARNKKCVTLNLRKKKGQDILKEMVQRADFLIENFRPGTMEKWGLGYDELHKINPRLIMIRVSGYGQTGPYSKRAGYGSIGEAMGGMRNLAGDPSTPPSRIGLSIGDALAAMYACIGALAASRHREITGRGQVVDSAIYESVLAMMEATIPEYTQAGFIRERTGSFLPNVAPSNAYAAKDGDILIAANQDTVFLRLCTAMGREDLAHDVRYSTHQARGNNQVELDDLIGRWTKDRSCEDIINLMEEHGVPVGKIYKVPDMLADPHFKSREAIIKVDHPSYENFYMQNVFPKLSETPGQIKWVGPELGQHNDEIYQNWLGFSENKVKILKEENVI